MKQFLKVVKKNMCNGTFYKADIMSFIVIPASSLVILAKARIQAWQFFLRLFAIGILFNAIQKKILRLGPRLREDDSGGNEDDSGGNEDDSGRCDNAYAYVMMAQ